VIDFLATNWVWIAALALFIAMHRSGHGCGMHGGHRSHNHQPTDHGRPAEHTHHDEGTRSTS
jgi:hypothetical protein